ncbi:MAG: YqhA family protein [Anaerolineae bacterium]
MTQPPSPERRQTLFTRMFGAARFLMTVAVLAVFVGAVVLLIAGILEMAVAILAHGLGAGRAEAESVALRISVIEAVDVILVATVLFVIAFGLYQLFVDPALRLTLPRWLQVHAINELEARLAGMVVVVLGIIAMTRALDSHAEVSAAAGALAIAAVIAAISFFLYQEGRHRDAATTPTESAATAAEASAGASEDVGG